MNEPAKCEHCGEPLKGRNKRFCSNSCSRNHMRVHGRSEKEKETMRAAMRDRISSPEWKASQRKATEKAIAANTGRKQPRDLVERRASKYRHKPKSSPSTAKGETNIHAKAYHFRSPDNRTFHGVGILEFVRKNEHLFAPEDVEWRPYKKGRPLSVRCNAAHRLSAVMRGAVGTWKGWTAISLIEEFNNEGEDLLNRDH